MVPAACHLKHRSMPKQTHTSVLPAPSSGGDYSSSNGRFERHLNFRAVCDGAAAKKNGPEHRRLIVIVGVPRLHLFISAAVLEKSIFSCVGPSLTLHGRVHHKSSSHKIAYRQACKITYNTEVDAGYRHDIKAMLHPLSQPAT